MRWYSSTSPTATALALLAPCLRMPIDMQTASVNDAVWHLGLGCWTRTAHGRHAGLLGSTAAQRRSIGTEENKKRPLAQRHGRVKGCELTKKCLPSAAHCLCIVEFIVIICSARVGDAHSFAHRADSLADDGVPSSKPAVAEPAAAARAERLCHRAL